MKVIHNPSPAPLKGNTAAPRPLQPPATGQIRSKNRGDTVTLSKKAETIATAAQDVKAMGDVDMAKVDRVKAMLQSGTYQVDADKAATNMLTESLLKDP